MTKPRDLANSVNSASIPGARLENDAITASKMAPNSVDSSELANDAISTGKIQNLAITTAKVADGAITTAKVAGGPVMRAGGGTAFSVAHDTQTKATFGAASFDTASSFSSNRYTPNVAGYYQINAGVQYEGSSLSTNYAVISIYKNGTVYTEGDVAVLIQFGSLSVSDVVYLNGTTDYIEIFMAHKEGNAQNMRGKYFSAAWLRP